MRTIEEIINLIDDKTETIIDNISNESIDVFNFLKKQFEITNVTKNYLFQFLFRSFYRLDNAGLTTQFKTEYFNILEEYRQQDNFDFAIVLQRLFDIKNHRGQNTFQFSFVTKMQNTICNDKPIYDSEVAEVFLFKRPGQNLYFDDKLNRFLEQLKIIDDTYGTLIRTQNLSDTIALFDLKFPDHNLQAIKKLDFIFWSAGKVLRTEK
jgi:hypothetical protein